MFSSIQLNKKEIIIFINDILEKKINELIINVQSSKDSKNSETKSSAGDKYETGREMIEIEIEKNEIQISKTNKLIHELNSIQTNKIHKKINFGSIVFTEKFIYFISIPIGKILFKGKEIYCISLASPMGKILLEKKMNDSIDFQNQKDFIKAIL